MLYIGDTVEVMVKGRIVALRDSERPQGTRYEVVGKYGQVAWQCDIKKIKLLKKGVEHDRDSHK